ncbi:MAG: hypothetical protein IKO90_05490 [Bacteroidales bacterium]|nr:hypothetical protein [Bacteroidales bacterium]MBQ3675754.1 hypothetical protein [Bacteroidales bacterium]MBQ4214872.1 hypothetical protein [Bacteroidales bacterium]MBR4689898.1 hypothetical protein [Bacteroidales bacterium]MBR7034189.1 hypothetical protein [Bacteroidales bacterium]
MSDSQKRYSIYIIIMEYAWLTIAVSMLGTAIIDWYYHGINAECVKFLVMSVLSFGMYFFRRYKRKNEEKNESMQKKL